MVHQQMLVKSSFALLTKRPIQAVRVLHLARSGVQPLWRGRQQVAFDTDRLRIAALQLPWHRCMIRGSNSQA